MRGVIVDKAIYAGGVRHDIDGDISDAFDAARADGDCFLWIGLFEPDEDEFELVKDELMLHPLASEDAVSAHQRPKMERYDDTLFIVLKTLAYIDETSDIEVGEIMVFLGRDFVVTVRHGAGNPLGPVRKRLEESPELLKHGATAVLYAVCDEVVDRYGLVAHEVEVDIIGLERAVFDPGARDVTADIYSLKREVLEFRSAEDPLVPVLQEIVKGRVAECGTTREYFRDVLDHLLRVDGQVDAHNELLNSVLTAHLALLGKQQNEDMRKISAWAAIIAVPTAIAGIYGMNFDHMPELHWSFGYPLVIGVMAVICVLLFRRLRRSGWL
ncbi:magnesium/cobalt transporter CorA [Actinomadura madurae]|nr:magnesium/cobalt transporter CorA [Actinomadura madurae]MCP9947852.1 magnesium/cobalt transporter CorA [Actinomadura madurae]MCP9964621.1 magnesium/cobalt transporter CorA [Actinomadura madurae]MCP9977094.1 magnesium/cobalt transporter CorA [Actinomadura madurae]MCQ0013292.1 magnesium/cobalt transporter CorA [Actinomadura madurae]URM93518.1 magnesium/cobalt transporter CorA [Actinomadura madurae]